MDKKSLGRKETRVFRRILVYLDRAVLLDNRNRTRGSVILEPTGNMVDIIWHQVLKSGGGCPFIGSVFFHGTFDNIQLGPRCGRLGLRFVILEGVGIAWEGCFGRGFLDLTPEVIANGTYDQKSD